MRLQAHWMVAGAAQRCVVIAEGSCLASSNGRFSFTGTDRVEDGGAGQREGAAEPSTEGIDVDDTEMAARWGAAGNCRHVTPDLSYVVGWSVP